MTTLFDLALALLLTVLAIAAYVDRVYSEMGKFLAREYQDNIDAWTGAVEPRLRLGRESIALSASVLRQLSLAVIALLFGFTLWPRMVFGHDAPWEEAAITGFELILLILIFDRLIPQVLFTRTRGVWIARIRLLLQALFYLILPVTLLLGLLLSIAALAEPEDTSEEDHPSEAMDALLEAGEEEGILEQSDRALVRSVVEFGDKVVREVMTPRPSVYAISGALTLEAFLAELNEHAFSRVPVYSGTLDQVTGIAFAHDLLQVPDAEASHRTVAQIQRPAAFVPETKPVAELLREMQREKQHMRLVIDEYGGVAGLVTIEDLLEAIVGSIDDEHDTPAEAEAPIREREDTYLVPGSFEVSRLRELFAETPGHDRAAEDLEPVDTADPPDADATPEPPATAAAPQRMPLYFPQHYEATTIGGLVSEIAGHIPLPGEVVEENGLRLEVLASTDRKVDRVRITLLPTPE